MREKRYAAKAHRKRILSLAVLLALLISLPPSRPVQATSPSVTRVTTSYTLHEALTAFNSGSQDMEISIEASFTIQESLTITNESSTLTIKSSGGVTAPYILTRGVSERNASNGIIIISKNAKLILENIVIDGNKNTYND